MKQIIVFFFFVLLFSGCKITVNDAPSEISLPSGDAGALRFAEAKAVLNSSCVQCHDGSRLDSPDFTMDKSEDFVASGWIVPGDPQKSILVTRMEPYGGVASNMPPTGMTVADYQKIYDWVLKFNEDKKPGETIEPPVNTGDISSFQCLPEKAKQAEPDRLKRLSKREYINTLTSVLNRIPTGHRPADVLNLQEIKDGLALLPDDGVDESLKYKSINKNISDDHINAYYKVSLAISKFLFDDRFYKRVGFYLVNEGLTSATGSGCFRLNTESEPGVDECYTNVISVLGKFLFRRPLTSEEVTFYLNTSSDKTDKRERTHKITTMLFTSPNFLFRWADQSTPEPSKLGYESYTDYEIASNLSYLFWEDAPDDTLYDLAEQGLLKTEAGMNQAMAHIFSDGSKVKTVLRNFYDEYLDVAHIPNIDSDKTTYFANFAGSSEISSNGADYRADMQKEIYDLLEHYTWTEPKDFSTTLTTRKYFASTPRLSTLYGDSNRIWDGNNSPEFSTNERAGLLTRAGMLLTGGHQTSPIHTGVRIYRDIMCGTVPSPPALDEEDLVVAGGENFSTREHVEALTVTGNRTCAGCHSKFNDFGYVTEKYDALGRLRVGGLEPLFDENGQIRNTVSVDYSASLLIGGESIDISSPEQMSDTIAATTYPNNCYTKNLYEFVRGKQADLEKDGCDLQKVSQKMTENSGGMLEAFKSLMGLDFIKYKKVSED